jgi:hypothetical protein
MTASLPQIVHFTRISFNDRWIRAQSTQSFDDCDENTEGNPFRVASCFHVVCSKQHVKRTAVSDAQAIDTFSPTFQGLQMLLTVIKDHFPPGGALPVKRNRSNTGSSFRTAASSASLFTPRSARHLAHQAMLSIFVQPRSASRFVGRPATGFAEGMVVRGHIVTLWASTH